ncbi:MAG TPA: extracellular solute-binding protein [Candidatus Paceibacterota bacterium]|nr:extracellular solute-binding protein [Candidatus Paceibacterota bacterium]
MKTGMSIFQVILLCVFGAFAIAGILIFAFLIGSSNNSSIGEVVLWGTFDETAVVTVMRQLSENDDRLRQIIYVEKNPDTFEQELTSALAAGTGPDLYILRHDYAVIDAPKIASIPYEQFSREQFDDLFVEAAQPFLSADGVLAVPLVVDPIVMYWNRDLFANAGLARPPIFWDELQGVARAISKRNDVGSLVRSAVGLGEYANVTHAKNIIGTLILQAGGSVTARASDGVLQPALQARGTTIAQPAQSAVSFYTSFANPSQDIYSWNRSQKESREAFASGDLGLFIGLASDEPLIRRQNPNLNFGVAPLPQIRDAERSITGGYAYAFAVPRASKNPEGALTAAYLLASPEASRALSLAFGVASARRDVLAEPAQGIDDLFNKMAIIARLWEDPNPQATDRIFRDMIESITSGAAKITEALQRAEAAMREIQTP